MNEKRKKTAPSKETAREKVIDLSRQARVGASKMTDVEREQSFNRAMQVIYGAAPANDPVGGRH